MVGVFLGYYAVTVGSAPLWVIIVAILAMVLFDIYKSVVQGQERTER